MSAYHHKSAGRVERGNRTLRKDLNRMKGPLKSKLSKVTNNYNNKCHRAIRMSPNEAVMLENKIKFSKRLKI